MQEGKIVFTQICPEHYQVNSDIVDGTMQCVGFVWSEPDLSIAAKNSKTPRKQWWGRVAGGGQGGDWLGPYRTRKAAAQALV